MLAGDIWGMMNAESEEIKKLKEYQRKYENKISCLEQHIAGANHKLEKENKKLEEENKKLQFDYDTRGDIVKGLVETIEKLKEEN